MKNNRKKVVLADIAVLYDSLHKTPKYSDNGYPMVRVTDINHGYLDLSTTKKVDENTYKEFTKKYKPQVGDILFSRVGSYGNSSYVNNHEAFCLGQNTVCISSKHHIDSFYLYCCLNSFSVKQQIDAFVGGASQPTISLKNINLLEIPYPNLPTQKKIAAILSAYDDLIENNTRRIEILEEMARSLYREWFVNFRFPGHEQVKMVNSDLGLIPEGWEVKKLSTLVGTQYGYTESASEVEVGPKYLRGKDINKTSYIQWDSVPYCPINSAEYQKYKLNLKDILIIRMADPGKVGIVEKQINAVFASYLIRLNITSLQLLPYYLFYFLSSDYYQNFITGASTGTTRKSASAGVITDISMIIPSEKICQQFEYQISAIRKMLNNLLDKNSNLRQTRDLLLPQLISGEIDVENLDINTGEIAA